MWKPPDVRISGGFFLLWGWFVLSCGPQAAGLVLSAAALHETGHLLVLKLCRVRVRRLRLGALGAVLETAGTMGYGQELLAALAGPWANLLGALALSHLEKTAAAGAHAVLGLFNLLPIYPLDGGRALDAALLALAPPDWSVWVRRWVGGLCAAAVCAAALCFVGRTGGSFWLLPGAAGLWRLASAALRPCRGLPGRFPKPGGQISPGKCP